MKRTHKLLSPLLAAALCLSPLAVALPSAQAVSAAAVKVQEVDVYVDGNKLKLAPRAFKENGVTYVPMRPIFTALEADVTWEAKTQTVIGQKEYTTVALQVGKKEATINGRKVKLDAAAKIKNGNTFVPIRFVAESLYADVKWDAKAKAVRITSIEEIEEGNYEEWLNQLESREKLTPRAIVEQNDESVVLIHTDVAQGSGVVVGDHYILTNYHVMEEAASGEAYTIHGDRLTIKGVAAHNENADLAIIQTEEVIDAPAIKVDYPLGVGKGDKVVAIGSPLGLQNTVSDGLVSNVIYEMGVSYIQTSAPIDHGSSGGALFDEYGALIGITSAGYDSQADLNFAVSTVHAVRLMSMLPEKLSSKVKFLPRTLPDTLAGVSNDDIAKLMDKEFSELQTTQGLAEFTDWTVTRDTAGWIVLQTELDPIFYMYYGSAAASELRLWAVELGHKLHRMLPDDRIQVLVNFNRTYEFEPRGFAASEVTALGNDEWQVHFPIIDMQLKDQLYINLRD
ncbi:stalk domain-containing protein [Paenibacillus sp. GCM10023252]|uniref:stalk domain-containing protein n=1 Tax=Paenibacillus sp. GCM10023252 TaxID=3252649 RepID=UPI00361A2921